MSAPAITTGVVIAGKGSPCEDLLSPCVYFTPDSVDNLSHVFTVNEPWQVLGFNMAPEDRVVVQQASGSNEGDFFSDVLVNGQLLTLDSVNNRMLIPYVGRFRLRYDGELGSATVVCEPSSCCMAPLFPPRAGANTKILVTNTFNVGQFEAELESNDPLAVQVVSAFGNNLFLGDQL